MINEVAKVTLRRRGIASCFMADTMPLVADKGRMARAEPRQVVERFLGRVLEGGALALVVVSPWASLPQHADGQALLYAVLALLLVVWGTNVLLRGRLRWPRCPVLPCLAALFLLAALQAVTLPSGILARLSPATARLYERLLPSSPEQVHNSDSDPVLAVRGATLSLYPYATRQKAVLLLAIFLVYALVRSELTSAAALRRLCFTIVLNGTLLALFALSQILFAPANGEPGAIRGSDALTLGMELGVGLGVALLLGVGASARQCPAVKRARTVGVAIALVGLLSAIALSGSHAAFLALLVAALTSMLAVIRLPLLQRELRASGLLVLVAGAVVLGTWLHGHDGSDIARSLENLPFWGTGAGTYTLATGKQDGGAVNLGLARSPVGNGCLEVLVEGGVARLAMSALAVALVLACGVRACRRHAGSLGGGLALGAFFAFIALVVHSAMDSGLHNTPEMALPAAVLAAQLCGMATLQDSAGRDRALSDLANSAVLPRGWSSFGGAVASVVLAMVFGGEAWKLHQVHASRDTAAQLEVTGDLAACERQVGLLQTAVLLAPGDADLQLELGRTHERAAAAQIATLEQKADCLEASQALAAFASPGATLVPACWSVVFRLGSPWLTRQLACGGEREQARNHRQAALRHVVLARDACPLWVVPHLWIARRVDQFEQANPRSAYVERAQLLAPDDPSTWYQCGIVQRADREGDASLESWRRCLRLSDLYLGVVLDRCSWDCTTEQLLRQVLPDRPKLLAAAGWHLYPDPEDIALRRPFMEKALAVLDRQACPLPAEDLHLKAVVLRSLGRHAEAFEAYQAALVRAPQQVEWYFEVAEMLHEQDRDPEARTFLLLALERQPDHRRARSLLNEIGEQGAGRER
jgi:tetratricopeptide (TPR) repeat protein